MILFIRSLRAVFDIVFSLVYTIMPGLIINELIGERRLKELIIFVCLLTVSPFLAHLLRMVCERKSDKLSKEVNHSIERSFYEYYASMDYESVENPEIGLQQERAQDTLDRTLDTVNVLIGLLTEVLQLIAISSIISFLHPLLVLFIVGVTFVDSVVSRNIHSRMHVIDKEIYRVSQYTDSARFMLYQDQFAKEIRLFHLAPFLIRHFDKYIDERNHIELNKNRLGMIPGTFASITSVLQQVIIYAYLIFNVLKKSMPIGNMTIFLSATGQLAGALNGIFDSYTKLSSESLNIRETIAFMEIPLKQLHSGTIMPQFKPDSLIEFRNVSFKYPGSNIYAIKNLSIKIHANERLCIVGENGSGKSTFIKLLTRLYWPTEGEILLDGVNIYNYQYEAYQKIFSPVFQDFCGYFLSLRENIVLNAEYNQEKYNSIIQNSGLADMVNKLEKGSETQIGKWVDEEGIQPSGGEFQKIAIARALYNSAPVYLLDEPTAALDPNAEYEIYTQFHNMIEGNTAVLITHRLSAVQLADKVAVFKDGQVAEYGTHQSLYAKGGLYTEMFDKQAKFYREGNSDEDWNEELSDNA